MFRNYLKTTFRAFWRDRFTSIVNILGLTTGIAGCLLIGLFVRDEWKYDRAVPEGDRIFRVYTERISENGRVFSPRVPIMYAPTMEAEFPEVGPTVRLMQQNGELLFEAGEQSALEGKGAYVEKNFFEFFGLPLREGEAALIEPNTVVLTESLARKYFGDESPVGRTFEVDGQETTVVGVSSDLPEHFHVDFRYFLSMETVLQQVPEELRTSWGWYQFYMYLKVKPQADAEALAAKLPDFADKYIRPQTEQDRVKILPHLQPLKDIYLHSADFVWDAAKRGNITHVWGLSVIGLFLLSIAIINFVNLSTARAGRRAREVGVRKVSGAVRSQLVAQFAGEAILLGLIAVLLAGQLIYLLLPVLNEFTGKSIAFEMGQLPALAAGLVGLGILVGVLAGIYPAFILSAFRPVQVLKGDTPAEGAGGQWLRKGLVVVQFSLTVLLIAASLVIYRQVSYMNSKDLGFDREHVLYFTLAGDTGERFETVKEEFKKIPGVVSASAAYGVPGDIFATDAVRLAGSEINESVTLFNVDYDYVRTLGLDFVAGRDFSREFPTDTSHAFVINETAVRELGFGDPEQAVGRRLEWDIWGRDSVKQGQVIGVVRDFHSTSLHQKVTPLVMHIFPEGIYRLILRIKGDATAETLAAIDRTWESFGTGYPLQYHFVDESFDAMYRSEGKLTTLLLIFTALTIFVACLGLLGLAMFAARQRTKEIGIRKVLGAGVGNIVGLLAGDFIRLVVLAILIATPLAWYFLNNWLEGFAYRIGLSPWLFAAAAALAIVIALLTVSFHSLRAALANPVESLKYE